MIFTTKISFKAAVKVQRTRVCKHEVQIKLSAFGLIPTRWLLTNVTVDLKCLLGLGFVFFIIKKQSL